MGNCCLDNKKESLNSTSIDEKLKNLKAKIDNEIKILLLGTGDSGKSTIVKQMRLINDLDFDQEEREEYVERIRFNIITNIKSLVHAMDRLNVEYSSEKNKEMGESIKKIPKNKTTIDSEMLDEIKSVWSDKGIQEIWKRRAEFQVDDTSPYYFGKIDKVAKSDYLPNNQDILQLRVKTTGIVETQFESSDLGFRMFDVGGQRNERKKWIHCFQDVTALIFCVSMSEYDQTLYEDENQKRMTESLQLFEEILFRSFYDPPRRQEKLKNRRKLTLVLDLDETLVHSCQIPKPNLKYDMTVKCTIQKIETLFYVYKRPYVDQFLKQASKWFNIVIFTSSLQVYADPIIDFLDPNHQVKERLFRESCEQLAGNWIKDLSVLFTRFDRCVIVDNSPVAFTRNWENGIPIRTWDGDPLDKELKKLLTFLDGLRSLRDVRHILKFRSLSYN